MKDVIIHKVNESYVKLVCSDGIAKHVYSNFRFTNNKLKYHPKVKARLWDGYINLFNIRNNQIYLGLIEDLVKFFIENGYTYEFSFKKEHKFDEVLLKEALALVEDEFQAYDHQSSGIEFALKNNRGIVVSATASGKSFILYVIAMYYLLLGCKKILLIVPRTQLVEQLSKDFLSYHKGDKKSFESLFELIYSGSKKNNNSSLVFSTWQSIHNNPPEFFEDFDVVLFDEAHMAKSKSLTSIMEKCSNAKFKFGFTGTLTNQDEESEINTLVLKGLFGKIETVSTNKDLMDKGILTPAVINLIRLKYTDKELCKLILKGTKEIMVIKSYSERRKKLFEAEVGYIIDSEERNNFVSELSLSLKGNTFVLFQFERHGKRLFETLKSLAKKTNKEVYYIDGHTKVSEREKIREILEKQDNVIVVCSFGTTSTGINVKNLHNLIFASAFKASIVMKQSIGRGLRKHASKEEVNIYDIGDDFSDGKKDKNFLFDHFMKRIELYKQEKFKLKTIEHNFSTNHLKGV